MLALISCNNAEDEADTVGRLVTSIPVSLQQPKVAVGLDRTRDGSAEGENNGDDLIITESFTNGDKLYFSQLGPSQDPNFSKTPGNPPTTPYLYIYDYKGDTGATWADGYNFSYNQEEERAFDWDDVRTLGTVGNSFSLYAFYFPIDNAIRFNVEKDQSEEGNFRKSDIMGAYHATSSLYTRLRFRLFHLMVYLKVTLYVPVYEDNKSPDATQGNYEYSGFGPGAVQGAYVLNAATDFSIEWRANRSSDTEAPLAQTASTSAKTNIRMYSHEVSEAIIEDFQVTDYYTDQNITKDRVRAYQYSVLFPAQDWQNGNILCFALKDVDESIRYFYFAKHQLKGSEASNFGLTQGTLQQLYLYLPRKTNETILVGAQILPWSPAVTDMTVTEKTTDSDNGGNGD